MGTTIQPITGGMVRSTAIQSTPPFTTPDCVNVRPRDQIDRRLRNGSRPGLKKGYAEQLGSGAKINMLNTVRPATSTQGSWSDEFQSTTMSTNWTLEAGSTVTPAFGLNSVRTLGEELISAFYLPGSGSSKYASIYRSVLTGWDTTKSYRIQAKGAPTRDNSIPPGTYYHPEKYWVFLGMDPTTPDPYINGVIVEFSDIGSSGGRYVDASVKQYLASALTTKYTGNNLDYGLGYVFAQHPFDIDILVNYIGATSMEVVVYLNGSLITAQTCALSSSSHHRFGIGLLSLAVATGYPAYDRFVVSYAKTGDGILAARKLVAASNATTYIENQSGSMASISGNAVSRSDVHVRSVEYLGNLYCADWSTDRCTATDGSITGGSFTLLTSATIGNFANLGTINTDTDVVLITNGTGTTIFKAVAIASVVTTTITTATPMATALETGVTFRIARCPKKIDVDGLGQSLYLASSTVDGFVPIGCKIIGLFQERIVLTGDYRSPGVVYMSRISDPLDWDFGAYPGDVGGAWSTATSLQSGQIGEDVTCFINFRDDFCIFGCENSTYLLSGNPRGGGSIQNLSRTVGPLSSSAWCVTPTNEVLILTRDGIYSIQGGTMVSLSREALPKELIDIDTRSYNIFMEYDVIDRGVHINLTPIETAGGLHYWFDYETRGFWPMDIPDGMQPWSITTHELPGGIDRRVILGCRDGYLRHYDEAQMNDDGTTMDSYLVFGPVRLGDNPDMDGILTQLEATLALGSQSVTWAVQPGDTPEEALAEDAQETGTWVGGLNYTVHPRVRGNAICIKVSSSSAPWAIERMSAERKVAGRTRKL